MTSRCGYVAIVGRPNVGKSTLLNQIMGHKLSITSKKPQTTRHQLLGIVTRDDAQALYVDTPGIHSDEKRAVNRYMNRAALSVLKDVDCVVFVVDRTEWSRDDELVAQKVEKARVKTFVVVNKVDLLRDKARLLPLLSKLQNRFQEADIVPVSAENGDNLERLQSLVMQALPKGPILFPEDQLTDRSERFLVAEVIREKVMRQLGDELPYAVTIQIERFETGAKSVHIDAVAFVERDGQKGILIGKGGERLKRIGADARKDIEAMLGRKVMLTLWAKVKAGWSDDERALQSLGYDDV